MLITKGLQNQDQVIGLSKLGQQSMFQIMHAFIGGIDMHRRTQLNRHQQDFFFLYTLIQAFKA